MGSFGWRVLLGLQFCFSLLTKGQEVAYHFHHLSEQLTSSQYNYYVIKDAIGFVWISSTSGVNRYDGREVRQMPGASNITSPFFEDGKNNLWFQSDNFIRRYDREADSIFTTRITGRPVFLEDSLLWMVDGAILRTYHHFSNEIIGNWPIGSAFGNNIQMVPLQKGAGFLLFLSKSNGFQVLSISHDGPPDTLFSMTHQRGFRANIFYPESDETWWIGADTGLVRVQLGAKEEVQIFSKYAGTDLKTIKGIVPLDENRLLIATHKQGLYFFEKGQNAKFTHQISINNGKSTELFQEQIDAIYLDDARNLWVSTQDNGVYFTNLEKRKFQTALQRGSQMPKGINLVEAMSMDGEGRVWCLTKNGLAVIDTFGQLVEGHERYLGAAVPFGNDEPMHIFCDSSSRVWIGMQSKLFTIPAFGEKVEVVQGSRGTRYINKVSNTLVVSTAGKRIQKVVFENGKPVLRDLPGLQQFPGDYLMTFQSELNEVAFFCRDGEVLLFRQNGENKTLECIDSFKIEGLVTGFADDPNTGRTWMAVTSGLFYFEKASGSLILRQDRVLTGQKFHGILVAKNGTLWLSTANGLLSYHPDSVKLKKYTLADGLQSREFVFWSALKVGERKFLFGGLNGVNIFDPESVRELSSKARPAITKITVRDGEPLPPYSILSGGKNFSNGTKIRLKYSDNSLRIQFAALEYSDPQANQFKYVLSGPDGELRNLRTENSESFANLREGTYLFRLWACNSDGVGFDDADAVQLKIIILPPWYRSWWFYLLMAVIILSAGYLIYRRRVAQIKAEELLKRQLAELRQKEAEAKQQVAETETAILRLQMNPHFIFNSMNSINSYILKKDINTASDYLGRFAKLMRMILKYAANPFITVTEEIELLELYLQTEAMRFERSFTYEFTVDEALDPDDTILPTMILQPFVENAI